eukprot:TRINITY_DN828_c0_g1_i1.p1 TRINITY_DN828_c0_g1~~TRINITY_DN828_c0_g1_i1.p1  ORF type:complete len:209 (-),score=21.03 TRINITY_DN828_c0_g1_i1:173-799(-)
MNDKTIRGKTLRVEFSRPLSRPRGRTPPRGSTGGSGRRYPAPYEHRGYTDSYDGRGYGSSSRSGELRLPRSIPPPTFGGMPLMGYDERAQRYVVLTPDQTRELVHKWAMELFPGLSGRFDSFDDLLPPPPPRSSRSTRSRKSSYEGRYSSRDGAADSSYVEYDRSRSKYDDEYEYGSSGHRGSGNSHSTSRRSDHYTDDRRSSRYRPY